MTVLEIIASVERIREASEHARRWMLSRRGDGGIGNVRDPEIIAMAEAWTDRNAPEFAAQWARQAVHEAIRLQALVEG